MNKYDEALAGEPVSPDSQTNKYDTVIQSQQNKPNPRNALSYVADLNPDDQANIQRLSELTGIPSDMVVRNRKQVERQAKLASVDYDALLARAPTTNQFLTEEMQCSASNT